ncbi:hypothetical protein TWF481_002129 [Arthrobotrys musiformis]|uniref:DNA (cytosine-5-)-methyltransferase n=1 Tax=Arthrobotrys musiformis TaxID=47236 RepID=A0AAV9VU84_9PEZI
MASNKKPDSVAIDLTAEDEVVLETEDSSNLVEPKNLNTANHSRGKALKDLPGNLAVVAELSVFKERSLGSHEFAFEEIALNVGGCVELEKGTILEGDTKALTTAYFIRISKILTSHESQYVVGKLFKRARHGYGLFDKTPGEVFWIREKATVNVKHVVRIRELILTNHTELTCGGLLPRDESATEKSGNWRDGEDIGRLICRRRANLLDNAENTDGSAKHIIGDEGFVRMLEEFEADEAFRQLIKGIWTSEKDDAIFQEKAEVEEKAIDLTLPARHDSTPEKSQAPQASPKTKRQYTFGDFFCGAGGASCGAKLAGFKIVYGIDNWEDAVCSYGRNYVTSKAIKADICEFAANPCSVSLPAARLYADVIHLSCPCQFYSPVHTIPGKNDEINEVASLVVDRLLKVVRPRVVTSEQTFGINTTRKFKNHFAIVINQYVRNNYSVRWAVKDATEYGAASARKRLIVIASCPGEPLPNFPAPTSYNPFQVRNSPNSQRLPETPTIGQILASVPPDAANHTFRPYPQPKMSPFHLDQPFNKTITCDGGESKVHPNGKRPFTLRELATFQTFPIDYKFSYTSDTSIIKQM